MTYTKTSKELLELLNELGADINIEQSVTNLAFKIKLNSGETLKLGAAGSYRKLLNTFNEMNGIGIDINHCMRLGTTYSVAFFDHPNFKEDEQPINEQEETIDGTTNGTQSSSETVQTGAEEDSSRGTEEQEVGESGVDSDVGLTLSGKMSPEDVIQAVVEAPEPEEVVDENIPNWKSLSTPTYGKKKLAKLALDEYNIELDSTRKYAEMVQDFKDKYEESLWVQ